MGFTVAVLLGVIGGVLLVLSVLNYGRLGGRRAVGTAGAGLLLLGLTVSGIVDNLVDMLVGLTFNPLGWVGVGAAGLGVVMLSWSGMLHRDRSAKEPKQAPPGRSGKQSEVGPKRKPDSATAGMDDDMADIEAILRRRGIE